MSRRVLLLSATLLALGLVVGLVVFFTTREPVLPEAYVRPLEEASVEPMCPWREPEEDLRRYYPGATSHREETWVLSAGRPELTALLGRPPAAEEHVLHLNRVLAGERALGSVVTRRVKGSAGSIELVIALDAKDRIQGIRFQRMREPEAVRAALNAPGWLSGFKGRGIADLPDSLPAAATGVAAEPAKAVLEGVRSTLAMVQVARAKGVREAAESHH